MYHGFGRWTDCGGIVGRERHNYRFWQEDGLIQTKQRIHHLLQQANESEIYSLLGDLIAQWKAQLNTSLCIIGGLLSKIVVSIINFQEYLQSAPFVSRKSFFIYFVSINTFTMAKYAYAPLSIVSTCLSLISFCKFIWRKFICLMSTIKMTASAQTIIH